jgi:hypothetical protein
MTQIAFSEAKSSSNGHGTWNAWEREMHTGIWWVKLRERDKLKD